MNNKVEISNVLIKCKIYGREMLTLSLPQNAEELLALQIGLKGV